MSETVINQRTGVVNTIRRLMKVQVIDDRWVSLIMSGDKKKGAKSPLLIHLSRHFIQLVEAQRYQVHE